MKSNSKTSIGLDFSRSLKGVWDKIIDKGVFVTIYSLQRNHIWDTVMGGKQGTIVACTCTCLYCDRIMVLLWANFMATGHKISSKYDHNTCHWPGKCKWGALSAASLRLVNQQNAHKHNKVILDKSLQMCHPLKLLEKRHILIFWSSSPFFQDAYIAVFWTPYSSSVQTQNSLTNF